MNDAKVEVDVVEYDVALKAELDAKGIAHTLIEESGPGGGCPVILLTAQPEALTAWLEANYYDLDAHPFTA